VIASHYAEPVLRQVCAPSTLRSGAFNDADSLSQLQPGERFLMLDDSLGWAWGYAGDDGRVGYVPSAALAAQCSTDA
jgi:hypothetical protein